MDTDESSHQNLEATWRKKRYEFFDQSDTPVVTAHHLDDEIENFFENVVINVDKVDIKINRLNEK